LRVVLRKPKWDGYMSALKAMQAAFTPDEVYAHLKSFEKNLKQVGEHMQESKAVAFSAHNHSNTFNSQFPTDSFLQRHDHEASKDAFFFFLRCFKIFYISSESTTRNGRKKIGRWYVLLVIGRAHHPNIFQAISRLKNKKSEGDKFTSQETKMTGTRTKKKSRLCSQCGALSLITVTPTT
jgi:hypothetical protein